MKVTSEAAFEALIEEHLLSHGYVGRDSKAYDADLALIRDDLLGYVRETQPDTWAKLERVAGDAAEQAFLSRYEKECASRGVLTVLRHGVKVHGRRFRVATFRPASGLNDVTLAAYDANRVAVVRQVHFDPKDPRLSVDLVLFVNGIPVVTIELKNPFTGQNAEDAKRQYERRDPDAPLFRWKRGALVHFATGTDRVQMTTRLARGKTRFLPFDRGHGTGAGNPAVDGRHRTFYLWEEVLERHSLLDLLARFLHVQVDEVKTADGKKRKRETMIFPRYHQLDCVRRLVAAARVNGAGSNYLVQHSAGSGKSNSIAWLAHRLKDLHTEQDEKVFHGVVVITDRVVLDRQLQDTIYQFEHRQGVVAKIDEDSAQLAAALADETQIVITTIHKFGFVQEKIDALTDRRFAVIVDEAHSSQTGDMAASMKAVLGAQSIEARFAEEDADDLAAPDQAALRAALARGRQTNLSFFAFTATPKFKTLELFGHKDAAGRPRAFHLYSMRQAIEEGFILDVLRGYTTYERYVELAKSIEEDPKLDKRRAAQALVRFIELHPVNVAQKTEIVIEHFRSAVAQRLGGRAKAMVVTSSRLQAVRYKRAFDAYVKRKGYDDVGVLVAFSGEVRDPNVPGYPFTEPGMNDGVKGKEIPDVFAGPAHNVLIVANKFQTGFDQPLLVAMYVDKRLSGIQAVQTLSRLNRAATGKDTTFVLDFVNSRDEILRSFQPYYEGVTTEQSVDRGRLHDLEGELDDARIYFRSDIDEFARSFFKAKPTTRDTGIVNGTVDRAVDRFKQRDDEDREQFRGKLRAFVNLYGFLAQILPFSDPDLEKLYAYARKLLTKLPGKSDGTGPLDLGDDVALRYYRLEKVAEGDIGLVSEGTQELRGPHETGTAAQERAEDQLSHVIDRLNERFGTEFAAQDFVSARVAAVQAKPRMGQAARVNSFENFRLLASEELDKEFVRGHDANSQLVDALFGNPDLRSWLYGELAKRMYLELNAGA